CATEEEIRIYVRSLAPVVVPSSKHGEREEKGPAARRRPRAAREAYSLYVPLGGGPRPPSETSPQDSLRRQSRRSKAEHFHVGRRAPDEDSHGPALNVPVRARASPAQPIPG